MSGFFQISEILKIPSCGSAKDNEVINNTYASQYYLLLRVPVEFPSYFPIKNIVMIREIRSVADAKCILEHRTREDMEFVRFPVYIITMHDAVVCIAHPDQDMTRILAGKDNE